LCIGCRACQVACKEWNDLLSEDTEQTGSYENPKRLSGDTWKQVKFIEMPSLASPTWLFYSDSCKHCQEAPCLDACPTGAIFRTEDGMVLINEDVCNGNKHCVAACPFQVVEISKKTQTAAKCTFCYERISSSLKPACAKVCPTDCIQFGERSELLKKAHHRLDFLKNVGVNPTRLYGEHELGGLGVFYVLMEEPEAYGLPEIPNRPVDQLLPSAIATAVTAVLLISLFLALV
jgi:formate dehydrogenase iron-sulfur subunit